MNHCYCFEVQRLRFIPMWRALSLVQLGALPKPHHWLALRTRHVSFTMLCHQWSVRYSETWGVSVFRACMVRFGFNYLAINPDKSEAIMPVSRQRLRSFSSHSSIELADTVVSLSKLSKHLGSLAIIVTLRLRIYVSNLCKSSFYHVRALRHLVFSYRRHVTNHSLCSGLFRYDWENSHGPWCIPCWYTLRTGVEHQCFSGCSNSFPSRAVSNSLI